MAVKKEYKKAPIQENSRKVSKGKWTQYSPTIQLDDEGKQRGQYVPFLKNGEIVWHEGQPYPAA